MRSERLISAISGLVATLLASGWTEVTLLDVDDDQSRPWPYADAAMSMGPIGAIAAIPASIMVYTVSERCEACDQ